MGTTARGEKCLLAIKETATESKECWEGVLRGLGLHEMNPLQLAITDGVGGLREALNRVYPETRLQRCWIHKERSIHSYMSPSTEEAASNALRDIWNAMDADEAKEAAEEFMGRYGRKHEL